MAKTTPRNTYYATIIYPESAPAEWKDILRDLHIKALISPLHNKDLDKNGQLKKEHYHVILIFESLKSQKQAQEVADKFGGVLVIPIYCLGAYSRYLCHTDDVDKAQYDSKDVIEIGGADYKVCCRTNDNAREEKNLMDLTQLILDNNITYFHKFVKIVIEEHEDWFHALTTNSYYLRSIIMSLATEKQIGEIQ